MNTILQIKAETLLIFLGSFSMGHFFLENAGPLGTFVGAILSTLVVKIGDWAFKKIKNKIENKKD